MNYDQRNWILVNIKAERRVRHTRQHARAVPELALRKLCGCSFHRGPRFQLAYYCGSHDARSVLP